MWKPLARVLGKTTTTTTPPTAAAFPAIVEDGPVAHGDDLCRCVCHRQPGVVHCKPCCRVCPHCRQRIVDGKYEEHLARCVITGNRMAP